MSNLIRGDTHEFRIAILDTDGQPYDLKGATVTVTAKRKVTDNDADAVYRHWITVDASGTVTASQSMTLETDATTGVVIERIEPAESYTFEPGSYKYDVEVRKDGDVYTPIIGEPEKVVADYTREAGA